ncbi:MAG: two-component sensor histidine kinase [Neisseria sp.]|jgi:sensor protein qseC|uniref:ATP-binding protein n=1 Tax=Neisseria sicca TaxID=490 RepID=UPI0008A39659|nr:ATP-binding protein [Neisseria sicca]OFT23769.1 two-component sensor histidine kinase [Neisseria sp. HMSC03D10]RKV82407.1 MAG: two-component sensor histidine kinase [Neisseria sp.]VTX84793.1 Sensor protein QseC [Neisseria sicca]
MFKKLPPETSIRKRLILYIGSGLLLAWFAANAVSLAMALHELNESADSQMSDLAQSLPYIEPEKAVLLPKVKKSLGKGHTGFAEDKQNGISVWNADGRLLLSDKRGKEIPFRKISGFTDIGKPWQEKSLRVIYYHDGKTGQTVAVAQPWRNRLEILWNIVWAHLAASLLVLPLMVLLLHLAVKRSIYPLKELASELSERRADNLAPVSRAVPQETQTLVDALNRLFARVQTSIEREQRFTSDAAHELRSPLAALKVQAEVLALSDTAEQPYHLQQIQQSLNRAEHLINQLLTLARLDPEQGLKNTAPINWESLSSQVLQNTNLSAREKRIRLKREFLAEPPLLQGDDALLQLMLRNLLDNAVRYSPENSEVGLYFHADRIEVRDQGTGIAPEHLSRIKERFYRPAGQNAQGSGLGLSIAEHIAKLHGLTLKLENRDGGGLSAWLERA